MNSLLSYGSDDDFDDSSDEKQTDRRPTSPKKTNETDNGGKQLKQSDANYDEVQMDLSEESNDSCPKSRDRRHRDREDRHRRYRSRSSDRHRYDSSRSNRDRYDKYRSSGSSYRDRRSKRSSSRDRRSSNRSPPPPKKSSSRSRSRSKSKERNRKSIIESLKMPPQQLPVLLPQQLQQLRTATTTMPTIPTVVTTPITTTTTTIMQTNRDDEKKDNRFFMPGITGRFRDQIERRKLLWQKKETTPQSNNNVGSSGKTNGAGKKVWETTTFAQDTDGKVANKFKRLMGIRNTSDTNNQAVDVLKKQEEMFSSMEQQYEVARTATHTMRGVGLGFSSSYPR